MKKRTLLSVGTAAALAACSSPSDWYLPCELPPFGYPEITGANEWDGTCPAGMPPGVVVPIDDDLPEP
jgi:hypothetical protein